MPALFLCTDDPLWVPGDKADFTRVLAEIGLTGPAAGPAGEKWTFLVGPQFLSLVTFLGCSPQVVVDPAQAADGQSACTLRLHVFPEVRFIASGGQLRVRCPACRAPCPVAGSSDHDALFVCEHCQAETPFSDLDWRQSAGFGRCFLEVVGIYPHEALPSDKLLAALQRYSGTGWRYFYRG